MLSWLEPAWFGNMFSNAPMTMLLLPVMLPPPEPRGVVIAGIRAQEDILGAGCVGAPGCCPESCVPCACRISTKRTLTNACVARAARVA